MSDPNLPDDFDRAAFAAAYGGTAVTGSVLFAPGMDARKRDMLALSGDIARHERLLQREIAELEILPDARNIAKAKARLVAIEIAKFALERMESQVTQ